MIIHNIWVRNYRNLDNQYFDFTGNFNLVIGKDNTIKITEGNKAKVEKYFHGKNINYLSGVIGKNGAGKSNLLELINYLIFTPKSVDSDFVLIFENNEDNLFEEIVVVHKLGETKSTALNIPLKIGKKNTNVIQSLDFEKRDVNSLFFTNVYDGMRKTFPAKVIDLSINYNVPAFSNLRNNINNEIAFFNTGLHDYLKIEKPLFISVRPYFTNRDQILIDNVDNDRFLTEIRSSIVKRESKNALQLWILYFLFIDLLNQHFDRRNHSIQKAASKTMREKRLAIMNQHISRASKKDDIYEILHHLVYEYPHKALDEIPDDNYIKLIDFILHHFKRLKIRDYVREGKYITRTDSYLIDFNEASTQFMTLYSKLYERGGRLVFAWEGISSGHKAFLNLFSRLFVGKDKIKHKSIILMIDEGDLYFHPQWQKEYVKVLVEFLEHEFSNYDVQLILTSHSPFIASDIPSSNLILLKTREDEGNFVEREKGFQTFGANIFELFTQAFFIKNGTTGDFADKKTKEIIDSIRNQATLVERKKLVELIGDDFLRKYITKHFIENDKAN